MRRTYEDVKRGADVCPGCGGTKTPYAAICESCRNALKRAGLPRRVCPGCGGRKKRKSALCDPCRAALKRGTPGSEAFQAICPDCGGPKHRQALVCRECRARLMRGLPPQGDHVSSGVSAGLYTTERDESIITFRNVETGELQTRHCFGRNVEPQIENGRRKLPPGRWVVESRSTPLSIFRDLQKQGEAE